MIRILLVMLAIISIALGILLISNVLPQITGKVISEKNPKKVLDLSVGLLLIMQGTASLIITKKNTKGQAALEFMLTYGWAILAGVIGLGVFVYITGFNRSAFPETSFMLDPPFYGNGYKFDANQILLEVKNNGPTDYEITKLSIAGCGDNNNNNAIRIPPGHTQVLSVECQSQVPSDFKGKVTIDYKQIGESLTHQSSGSVGQSASSYTTGQTILCSTNGECGSFINNSNLCTTAYTNCNLTTSPLCANPGTSQSLCTNQTVYNSCTNCTWGCNSGQCINGAGFRRCINNTCSSTNGIGEFGAPAYNDCSFVGIDCTPTHAACVNSTCTIVQGAGQNNCFNAIGSPCSGPKHLSCVANSCVVKNGAGNNTCTYGSIC